MEKWYCMCLYVYSFTSYDMSAILDLLNIAPKAGVRLGSAKTQKDMALAIRDPNLVLLERFEQFRGNYMYELSSLTNYCYLNVV